jgi:hypothetical protein
VFTREQPEQALAAVERRDDHPYSPKFQAERDKHIARELEHAQQSRRLGIE